jgi:hypothetical protein
VPSHCLPEVRREIRHYNRFKALITEWADLSIEQSRWEIWKTKERRRP